MNTLTEKQIWGEPEVKARRWSIDGRIATQEELFDLCAERGLPAVCVHEAVSILAAFDFQVRPLEDAFSE